MVNPDRSSHRAAASSDPIGDLAARAFGDPSLRPGQREAIISVAAGRDTLVVMSTGSGKSAIYELGGLLRGGPTVVISPLIALQRDQLAALQRHGDLTAVALNSAETASQRRRVLDQLDGAHRPDFVFLAPEQLADADVLRHLIGLVPTLIAVDEAHLVSRWGQDFRPDYLRIGAAAEAIGRPPLLALTATAAPPVREEIGRRLRLRDPSLIVRGFARPNIDLAVHSYFLDDAHKTEVLATDAVEAARGNGRGIVYGATRWRVEQLAAAIGHHGVRAAAYHAGLAGSARQEIEGRFRRDDLDVVVATIAFGMGVDKPDVRWVFHLDPSGSVDEYYQEFGRAGRDGQPATAALYFRPEDLRLPRMYASRIGPSSRTLAAVTSALSSGAGDLGAVRAHTGLSRERVNATVMPLADVGALVVEADGTLTVLGDLDRAAAEATALIRERRALERARVDQLAAYARHVGCRWNFVLEYFGEPADERCGHCDNDRLAGESDDGRPYPRGSRVHHRVFGDGEVIGYAGRGILIEFDRVGYKRLDLTEALDEDALDLAPDT
jgi:ATP-dependent DNA helicase RecQ